MLQYFYLNLHIIGSSNNMVLGALVTIFDMIGSDIFVSGQFHKLTTLFGPLDSKRIP